LSLISKDNSFDAINALQILFNYLCSFRSYFEISAFSKHHVYTWIFLHRIMRRINWYKKKKKTQMKLKLADGLGRRLRVRARSSSGAQGGFRSCLLSKKIALCRLFQNKRYARLENNLTKWHFRFNKKNTIKNRVYNVPKLTGCIWKYAITWKLFNNFFPREAFSYNFVHMFWVVLYRIYIGNPYS